MYPTSHANIDEKGSQIKTGYDLNQPKSGSALNFVSEDKWNGFDITGTTQLVVLEAGSEGEVGNGESTCTLCQKGDNYEQVETEKMKNLSRAAKLGDYVIMTPTSTSFTTDTSYTGYSSSQTINPSELNLWRVIKKNADGTIEMVSEYTSRSYIYFRYVNGYRNYIGYLNTIAKQYENSDFTIGSRAMGYSGQTEILDSSNFNGSIINNCKTTTIDNSNEDIGCGDVLYEIDVNLVEKAVGTLKAKRLGDSFYSQYVLASRYVKRDVTSSTMVFWSARTINNEGVLYSSSINVSCSSGCAYGTGPNGHFRPIVILKANLQITSGDGTSSAPYEITNK